MQTASNLGRKHSLNIFLKLNSANENNAFIASA